MSDGQIKLTASLETSEYDASVKRIEAGLKKVQSSTKEMSSHGVTDVQAISASLRALQGDWTHSLRSAERFIAQSKALSAVAKNMFPIAGGLAFAGMVVKAGTELKKLVDTSMAIPDTIGKAFQDLSLSGQTSLDELVKKGHTLEDQWDRLNKKPQHNGMAEFLDDAKLSADNLTKSLATNMKAILEITKTNHVGLMQSLTGGGKLTGYAEDKVNTITAPVDRAQQNAFDAAHAKGATPQSIATANKQVQSAFQEAIKQLKDEQSSYDLGAGAGEEYAGNTKASKQIITGTLNQMMTQSDIFDQTLSNESQESKNRNKQQSLALKTKLVGPSGESLSSSIQSQIKEAQNDFNENSRQAGTLPLQSLKGFYGQQANSGSSLPMQVEDATKGGTGAVAAQGRATDEAIRRLQDLIAARNQAADASTESGIKLDLENGKLTANSAAMAIAALHTREYDDSIQSLQETLTKANKSGDKMGAQSAQAAIDTLKIQKGQQGGIDQQAIKDTTFGANFTQMIKAMNDFPVSLADTLKTALGSFNNDILSARGFKQTGADLFKGVSGSLLNKAEGGIANKASGLLSGLGGLFSGLGFAAGGEPPVGQASWVGEQGKELFVPKTAGTIVSNKQLGNMGTQNYHVDMSGSNFAGVTQDQLHATVVTAMQHAVGTSLKHAPAAVSNRNSRRPSQSRG